MSARKRWTQPVVLLGGVAAIAAVALLATLRAQAPATAATRTLRGSWSAIGRVQTLPTETGRPAAVVQLSGAIVLTDDTGARAGFQGDAISFDPGSGSTTGRAVWTDTRGDRLYSVLRGDAVGTGRRVVGTITGGTGRYAGVVGDFELTWQYVVSAEDSVLQGRTTDLVVRYRSGEKQP